MFKNLLFLFIPHVKKLVAEDEMGVKSHNANIKGDSMLEGKLHGLMLGSGK